MKEKALDRRSFLKVGSLVGGGLLLNFSWLSAKAVKNEVTGQNEFLEFNAFVKITPDNVIQIMSPNPEGGQNVKTSMPMIVADELDADWSQVVVQQADLDTKHYTRQFIGGSQAIRQGWTVLRTAGATARQMLKEAAAQKWQVPVSEVTTEKGMLMHSKSGKKATYGEMATAASALPVLQDVKLKDRSDFHIIGTPVKNVEGKNIVTGKPLFGIDTIKEGMKIAMIVHPPAFGLKLKSYDVASVKKLKGIIDVFDIKVFNEDYERTFFDTTTFNEVVAIVGEDTWSVMKAKKALKVSWEPFESHSYNRNMFGRKSSVTVPAGLESTSESMAQMTGLVSKPANVKRQDGDVEKAFENASKIVEAKYSAPFLAHNCMEPMNFFADVREDKIEMIGPLQKPELTEQALSARLGVPLEKIDFKMTRLGGGYGRRSYAHWAIEAALISQKVKAPVKLVYSREDDMTAGVYRSTYYAKYQAALDSNNNLIGFKVNMGGNPESPIHENRFPAGAVSNYLAEDWEIPSNITTGSFRAPRSNFNAAAEQSFLDEVAEAAGKDPIDFRLDLLEKAKSNPVGQRNDYDADRFAGVLKLLKEKTKSSQLKYPGVSAYFCHNTYAAMVVDMEIQDGSPVVNKVICAMDCGLIINPDGAKNLAEGGIVDALGNALFGKLTFNNGATDQQNFDQYRMIRMNEAPKAIEVYFVENDFEPTGMGEPTFPPVFAAVANSLYRATGKRFYHQPFMSQLS
ncbi:xanthine dehydrogenase family protein molybdopterin-binding subunit [Jiulongibacter sediminis]|uniref:Isoquinoline 1-oxidoreductase n=1 Tax=Jiulongibacter sediminis TaxID=1605367 RepID=A0A0P7CAR4_9BACT|nr:molybdopterin cofactor-binding domain-containing protein [Jiulongibacter sediminis]KPM49775.1 isoquinoline 1-oxidoreductase [Jiulongibacter sediminis]TBX26813.1 isoquinoline 1-oxidoreductase [Jiulongibacter sediminis]